MIERNAKDGNYILSPNSAKAQYCIFVNKIRLIISESIIKIQLMKLSKLKEILYLKIHILLRLR